jgi:16S rRNA (cytidine1402-2'-O)-methyltransferase
LSAHAHNEPQRARDIVRHLDSGKSVALLCDAGTPALSDPGSRIVRQAVEAGHRVSPVPGPSALAAALSVAGFARASTDAWFVGFVPPKGKARRSSLDRLQAHAGVVVLYEAPHRLPALIDDLAARCGERPACVCRELTKRHEEVVHGTLSELCAWVDARELRGELTLVVGPALPDPAESADLERVDAALVRCLAAGLSPKDASTAVAAVLELSRRQVYARCQRLVRSPR